MKEENEQKQESWLVRGGWMNGERMGKGKTVSDDSYDDCQVIGNGLWILRNHLCIEVKNELT